MNYFRLGLTQTQINLLKATRKQPMTVKQLTTLLGVSSKTVNRSINKLKEKGLLEVAMVLAHNEKAYITIQ